MALLGTETTRSTASRNRRPERVQPGWQQSPATDVPTADFRSPGCDTRPIRFDGVALIATDRVSRDAVSRGGERNLSNDDGDDRGALRVCHDCGKPLILCRCGGPDA